MIAAGGPVIPNFGQGSSCVTGDNLFCWDWVKEHWGDTLQPALVQHIELTAIAIAVGSILAFSLALLAHRRRRTEQPISIVAALVYTFPSIALFQLLVPFTGLTYTTVEVALIAYTLVILFPNFVAGLDSAPPEVLEAARGMGLTRRQILTRVEIPLALPAMHRRPPGRRRLDDRDRDDRCDDPAEGARLSDLLRDPAPDAVQDRDLLGGRARGRARAHLRRGARRPAAGGHPVVQGPVIRRPVIFDAANAHTFVEALRFIVDNPHLLVTKALEQLELSGAAMAIALVVALPLGIVLGHLHRGSGLAIGASIVGRALPSIFLIAVFLTILGLGFRTTWSRSPCSHSGRS